MTDAVLTDVLAQRVMHWGVTADRYLIGNRSWIPKWRFNPLEKLEDAFKLLDHSEANRYTISMTGAAGFEVEVDLDGRVGTATREPKPRAITLALARSLGLEV